MFLGMRTQWRMIWHSKHQVFDKIKEILIFLEKSDVLVCQTGQFNFQPMHSTIVCSVGSDPANPDSPVSKTGESRISRTSDEASKTTTADLHDWRTPLVRYLENPSHIADRKVRWQALKYVVLDNILYVQL
jgi:hypothetical protein